MGRRAWRIRRSSPRRASRGMGEILQLAVRKGENGGVAELPLVGRARELEEVEARLGEGGCVAVAGPLGIGKSRLLAELAARADARGHVVLSGRGSEYEGGVPYGVTIETLTDYL